MVVVAESVALHPVAVSHPEIVVVVVGACDTVDEQELTVVVSHGSSSVS